MSSKVIALACSFLGIFAFLIYVTYDNHALTHSFCSLSSSTNQFIGPSFTKTVEFAENDEYKNLAHQNDYLWDDLLSPNGGFLIKVEKDGSTRRHGIGMFHQLHCIKRIRGALQRGSDAGRTRRESQHEGHHGEEHDSDDHILHCLDYLRQVMLST